ncbi:MAG: Snf7 family protein [Nitrososphaeraceae archaeon]
MKDRISFNKKWSRSTIENNDNSSLTGKIFENKLVDNIKPQAPLKPKIDEAQKKLQLQISKLDNISNKMQEKDQLIFKRVVYAMQNHDGQYAKVLSNELSQIRKMSKMVSSAKLAMEQIQLRLNTITELGDVVVTLSPAMSVIKGIQGGLSNMMPEADQSFGQISDLLSDIVNDSGQIPNAKVDNSSPVSEDSMKILEEASMIVEENMKTTIPDVPEPSTKELNNPSSFNQTTKRPQPQIYENPDL